MFVIKLEDGAAVGLPIAANNFRQLFPQTSFPSSLTPQVVEPLGYGIFERQPAPQIDESQVAEQLGYAKSESGAWGENWVVRNLTQEELDERVAVKRRGMKVSMRQARLALLQQGLLSQVEAAIAAMDEPARSAVQIEWEYAHVVDRASPWIGEMSLALGLTDEQMDGLFELAAGL